MNAAQANKQVAQLSKALKKPMPLEQKIAANRALFSAIAKRDQLMREAA